MKRCGIRADFRQSDRQVNRTSTQYRNIVASFVYFWIEKGRVRNGTRLKNKKGYEFSHRTRNGFCRILYKLILLFWKVHETLLDLSFSFEVELERIYRIFEVGVRFPVEISRYQTKIPRIFYLETNAKTCLDLFRVAWTLPNTCYIKLQ